MSEQPAVYEVPTVDVAPEPQVDPEPRSQLPYARDESGRPVIWLTLVADGGEVLAQTEAACAPATGNAVLCSLDGKAVRFIVLATEHVFEQAEDGGVAQNVHLHVQEYVAYLATRQMEQRRVATARRYRQ